MKKFIIALSALILLYLAYDTARYRLGWYIDLKPDEPVTAFMTTDTQSIYMDRGSGPEPFIVKGVNLGVGIPGEWATDYAVSKETYLRWFAQMQEMGANTVRVYITLHDDFYNAFYEYNTLREENGEEPLWLIHGVWVNDYIQNSTATPMIRTFSMRLSRTGAHWSTSCTATRRSRSGGARDRAFTIRMFPAGSSPTSSAWSGRM